MNKLNLKMLLVTIHDMIMRNRVAYKDYLGEETVTTTTLLCSGTITEDHVVSNGDLTMIQAPLTIKDSKFSEFVLGEEYDVTFDDEALKMTAYSLQSMTILGTIPASITSFEEMPDNAWYIMAHSSEAVLLQKGTSLLSKNVSVSQSKTVTKKKYNIKKIPEYLLPDTIAKKKDIKDIPKKLSAFTDDVGYALESNIPIVPTSLKNPYAITITIGSTTVTYDGSSAKSISISDGTEVSY